MSFNRHAQSIDEQVERLRAVFKEKSAMLRIDIFKKMDGEIQFFSIASAEINPFVIKEGLNLDDPKKAVDSLMAEAGITTVQQYVLINHTYRCEMCGETYHHPFSVTEINSESSYTILNACDNCQMQALHEIREQEELVAEQALEGGAK